MRKTLFIGDLHGRVEVQKRALATPYDVVFLGDFLDAYDRTVEETIECLDLALAAIKMGRARAVIGNHELSYMHPRLLASRWDQKTKIEFSTREQTLHRLLEPCIWYEDIELLVTHAGVSRKLWDMCDMTVSNVEDMLHDFYRKLPESPYFWVGYVRGGNDPIGGPTWCDFRYEFQPVPGVNQIVGHTRGKKIRTMEGKRSWNYCIDCLSGVDQGLLVNEDGSQEIVEV